MISTALDVPTAGEAVTVYENECIAAGKDYKEIARLASQLSHLSKVAKRLGVYVFWGSGSGTLRCHGHDGTRSIILAELEGTFDGGDGACGYGRDGLLRGE